MTNSVPLLQMFFEYSPEEPLRAVLEQAAVCRAEISREERRISLEVRFDRYVPAQDLQALSEGLQARYGIRTVAISPRFPKESAAQMEAAELNRCLIAAYSPAAATLAGCRWEIAEGETMLYLRANGKDALAPYLPVAERQLMERFSLQTKIKVVPGSTVEGEALFEETEKLRQAAMKDIPAPPFRSDAPQKKAAEPASSMLFGKPFRGTTVPMREVSLENDMGRVVVEGRVFAVNHKELKKSNAWVVSFDMTDYTGSLRINRYMDAELAKPIIEKITKPGMWLRVFGKVSFSRFENDIVLEPIAIQPAQAPKREDTAPEKRVELHLHTTMSMMDALTKTGDAVATAARWGHKAIAITDHGVASSFPDALKASKNKVAGTDQNIKILYGCEGYFLDITDDRIAAHGNESLPLDGEFVAFDLETTGLSNTKDAITEFGAVIIKDGEVLDTFQSFVDPKRRLDEKNIELTGITDAMLEGAPEISEVLPAFLRFCGDRPLVAHNAEFDIGFVRAAARHLNIEFHPTYIDTLVLARKLLPELKKHKLDIVAEALKLPEFNHHRASDDALTCGLIYDRLGKRLLEKGITDLAGMNREMMALSGELRLTGRRLHPRHIILFAKNQTGLRNLYHLISDSNLKYFYRKAPCIPRFELERYREGLIVGSACEAGELFQAILAQEPEEELLRIASVVWK